MFRTLEDFVQVVHTSKDHPEALGLWVSLASISEPLEDDIVTILTTTDPRSWYHTEESYGHFYHFNKKVADQPVVFSLWHYQRHEGPDGYKLLVRLLDGSTAPPRDILSLEFEGTLIPGLYERIQKGQIDGF